MKFMLELSRCSGRPLFVFRRVWPCGKMSLGPSADCAAIDRISAKPSAAQPTMRPLAGHSAARRRIKNIIYCAAPEGIRIDRNRITDQFLHELIAQSQSPGVVAVIAAMQIKNIESSSGKCIRRGRDSRPHSSH